MTINRTTERLHKVIANAGYCSRRKAELLIAQGKVTVNDEVVTDLGYKIGRGDSIKIAGEALTFTKKLYLLFYKPINCLTTLSDPKGRMTIMAYFNNITERIYPVGRLDFDTSGLLIMTNDGDFTYAILHPKYKVEKVYEVLCQGIISAFQKNLLENGVRIDTDFVTSPAKLKIITSDFKKRMTLCYLTIYEGHKNQIKRMLKGVGSKVIALKRVKIGNLTLANLNPGEYRNLTMTEIDDLINLSRSKNRAS